MSCERRLKIVLNIYINFEEIEFQNLLIFFILLY